MSAISTLRGIINGIEAATTPPSVATPNSVVITTADGTFHPSVFPAGYGDVQYLPATEALNAGAPVNLYTVSTTSGGTTTNTVAMRNADSATANAGKSADGFVLAAVASGASGSFYPSGKNTALAGLTPGAPYYLGPAGTVVTPSPGYSAGTTLQYLGKATAAGLLDFQPKPPVACV